MMRCEAGARVVGRKIGCTSQALQQLFGIDTPDFGHLFDDMLVLDGSTVDTQRLIAPMVEPEIAFLLADSLKGPGLSGADALAATAEVMPALEVIDSRIAGWDIGFCDTVADNGSSARFVLGEPITLPTDVDLGSEHVSLRRDGVELGAADATAVLGHPANAVAWLGNALAEFDRGLGAGQIVLAGSITKASRVGANEGYEAVFSTLGRVGCRFV